MREKTRAATVVVGVVVMSLAVVLLSERTTGQQSGDRMDVLIDRVEDLTKRVDFIEYVVGSYFDEVGVGVEEDGGLVFEKPTSTSMEEAVAGRYMRVDGIETSEHKEDYSEEIARLHREVESLERTILSEERSLASIQGQGTGTRRGRASGDRKRRADAQRRIVSNYKRTLTQRRKELDRLERAQDSKKQIIQGNASGRVIILHTELDLSSDLVEIGVYDYVTWNGKRIEMSQESETWLIRSVRKIEEGAED